MIANTTIYVVEDDHLYRKQIIHSIERYHSNSFRYTISPVGNHLHFMEDIPTLIIADNDIFFLDIDLKTQYTGIDLANKIREVNSKCIIIFLTSFEDNAISIINSEIFPLGYLIKNPIDSSDLDLTIKNALLKAENLTKNFWRQESDIITFMNGYESIYINSREILYIESLKGLKSRILIKTSSEELIIEGKIGKIKNDLKQLYLLTSLQSYIINLENITSIHRKNGTITFIGEQEIFVGTRIIDKVKKGLLEYKNAR